MNENKIGLLGLLSFTNRNFASTFRIRFNYFGIWTFLHPLTAEHRKHNNNSFCHN